jgi:hypothetical protein
MVGYFAANFTTIRKPSTQATVTIERRFRRNSSAGRNLDLLEQKGIPLPSGVVGRPNAMKGHLLSELQVDASSVKPERAYAGDFVTFSIAKNRERDP